MRLLFLIFLLSSPLLHAQRTSDTAVVRNSRWQTSFLFGTDPRNYGKGETGEDNGSRFYQYAAYYRFSRFFDLGLQVGFQRESASGFRDLVLEADNRVLTTVWNRRNRNTLLGLQPRFNYRLGQGDLGFTCALGFVFHQSSARINTPVVLNAGVTGERLNDYYYQAGLFYTYWPTRNFGITISADRLTMEHGKRSGKTDVVEGSDRYRISGSDIAAFTAELTKQELVSYLGIVQPSTNYYLSLGLLVRL